MDDLIEKYDSLISVPLYLQGDSSVTYEFDYIPNIRKSDIDRGYIKRYFVMRSNVDNGEIVEINKSQFSQLQYSNLHVLIELSWRISGKLESIKNEQWIENINLYTGVLDANKAAVEEAEKTMPGIKYKLSDHLQYYQLSQ